jgi:hypothetical protein
MNYVEVANTLAEQVIDFAGLAIPAWRLDEAKDVPQAGDLPHRLILPPGANGVQAFTGFEYVTGTKVKLGVQVADLLLWRTAGTAPNLDEAWPMLAQYCDAYMRHMMALRFVAGGMVSNVSPTTAVFEWPHKSNRFYHGAQIVVRVEGWLCLN